ncbi:hypothetical protein [Paracoccus sp. SM22M-07]|uniref:hypothetical protein n=1 Tax=Paracoccus sp. SM22M-07 TaxID=1520813 RepID=UPI00197FE2AF|nr:hypothetical protein [Paracoccus sp. SM22M-07]
MRKRGEVAPLAQIEALEIIAVDRATQCHVTPGDVARRMVDYLGPQGDYLHA